VAIARAIQRSADFLADEPGNLTSAPPCLQLLRDINAGGTSVIMATHNLELVRQTTYRTLELKSGQLVYDSADEPAEDTAP
jgi:cell division transport system ATP-binding protein